MPLVKATETWVRAVLRTTSGVAQRGANGVGNYAAGVATWLIDQGFGTAFEPDEGSALGADPSDLNVHTTANRSPEVETSEVETSETWETVVLKFLNQEDAEEIAHAVKGIGSVTASDLVEARPLTIEKLGDILNKRQMDALESWAEAKSDAEVS